MMTLCLLTRSRVKESKWYIKYALHTYNPSPQHTVGNMLAEFSQGKIRASRLFKSSSRSSCIAKECYLNALKAEFGYTMNVRTKYVSSCDLYSLTKVLSLSELTFTHVAVRRAAELSSFHPETLHGCPWRTTKTIEEILRSIERDWCFSKKQLDISNMTN